jgi:hypothetical protein
LQIESLPATKVSRLVQKTPFFYGWVVLAVGTLGIIMTSPGQTYAVSISIEHFIADLGLSRSLVSTLYAVGTLSGSLALPLVGRQIDRRGSRVMVVIISLLFGLACIYMGLVRGGSTDTARIAQLGDLRETLFMGNTLRGMLLQAYAFGTMGVIAGYAALASLGGAILFLVLGVAAVLHRRHTGEEVLI